MARRVPVPTFCLAPLPLGLAPEALAAAHPRWAADVARASPFRERPDGGWCSRGRAPDQLLVCGSVGSGLDVAWARLSAGRLASGHAVLAVAQRAGRGQLGRPWRSPEGNLYAAWRWPVGAAEVPAPLVPLAAAFCVAEGLSALGLEVAIKWPNDLVLGDRKVGGILVEARGDAQLVGVGLNLEGGLPADVAVEEGGLPPGVLPLPDELGPASLWHAIAHGAEARVRASGAAGVVAALERRLAWRGAEVVVTGRGGGDLQGRVEGLAPDGGLRLRTEVGSCTLHTGRLRRAW